MKSQLLSTQDIIIIFILRTDSIDLAGSFFISHCSSTELSDNTFKNHINYQNNHIDQNKTEDNQYQMPIFDASYLLCVSGNSIENKNISVIDNDDIYEP